MKKIIIGSSLLLMLVGAAPLMASAQTTSTTAADAVATLQVQIANLQAQLVSLQAALQKARDAQAAVMSSVTLLRQLRQGMSGDDVKALQQLLASDPTIYPEGVVSGVFGSLTKKAVMRFQQEHGMEGVGDVGPQTIRALNAFLQGKKDLGDVESEDRNDGNNNEHASSTPRRDGEEHGKGQKKIVICHKPDTAGAGVTISIATPALNAHLAHGDTVGACGGTSGGGTTDTTAPIISGLTASGITASSSTVSWATNENATATVWFGTVTPVLSDPSAAKVTNVTLGTSTSFAISGLTASTTYYYFAVATDASGNTATSSEQSFTTLGL